MALDDTLTGSIIGVSAGLTIVRQNHQAVVLVPIHSPLGVQTVVLHQCWVAIGIASIMFMPYLRGIRGVVAVPPEVLRLFGCLRCYDVRNIQILSTDRILFHGHEIHIHMIPLTKELSNCSPDVSFLMKHCLFSESFKLSRTNSLELSV